ncbi:MAG: AAA family ATPase [Roseiarcus sp.]
MPDAWVPIGLALAGGVHASEMVACGEDWQIWALQEGDRALLAGPALSATWKEKGLLDEASTSTLNFGDRRFTVVESGQGRALSALASCRSPNSKTEALAFALAMKASRSLDPESTFEDGIYVERLSRILPTRGIRKGADDGLVLGAWLTGGLRVSAANVDVLQPIISWLPSDDVLEVVATAGVRVLDSGRRATRREPSSNERSGDEMARAVPNGRFELPGRPELEAFFNEHVVDIVQNRARYKAMGVDNPGAILLEGPPGTGKTFAVDELVKFLGWPMFAIEAASVASPYIHETSRKVSDVFQQAIKAAPSVILIDEMEAFLSERDAAFGAQYRVEEIAEFLRRIPEAVAAGVLIVGMTNRIDMIDSAVRRRGRFDHIIHVDFPDKSEVATLLAALLKALPVADDVDVAKLATSLASRPLSDSAFVVREAARLAAKARLASVDQARLLQALAAAPDRAGEKKQKIGFT